MPTSSPAFLAAGWRGVPDAEVEATLGRDSKLASGGWARGWGWDEGWEPDLGQATGDDAYERYLEHCRTKHFDSNDTHDEEEPLDRKTFHKDRLDKQWSQPRRCC